MAASSTTGAPDTSVRTGRRRLLSGTCGAAVALALALPSTARAHDYFVSTDQQLRDAIQAANIDGDTSSTITLTGNISVAGGLPNSTKTLIIDTAGFATTGLTLTGNVTVAGTVNGVADTVNGSGQMGLNVFAAGGVATTVTNNATVTAGDGTTNNNTGLGANVQNLGTLINNGSITGGNSGGPTSFNGGYGLQMAGNSAVINNGLIQGGTGLGVTGGRGAFVSVNLNTTETLTNNATGVIRGGNGTGGALGGVGIFVNASPISIVNHGLIEGGNGAAAIESAPNVNIINDGIIRAGAGGTVAIDASQSSLTLIELRAGSDITGTVTANAGAAFAQSLQLGGTLDANFDMSLVGAGAQYRGFTRFVKTGTSTWTLTGSAAGLPTVIWELQGGTLVFDENTVGGAIPAILSSGGNSGALIFRQGSTLSVGNINGAISVLQSGLGTTTLTGNNHSGGTTLVSGTLSMGSETALGTGTFTITGGKLQWSGSGNIARSINWAANGAEIEVTGSSLTLAQPLLGGGALLKSGTGTLVLSGDNTYTGGTTIGAGTLRVNGSIPGDVTDNGTLTFGNSVAYTYAGAITGSGALTTAGTGLLALTGNSSYGGATTVNGSGGLAIGQGANVTWGGATALSTGTLLVNTGAKATSGGATTFGTTTNTTLIVDGTGSAFSTASISAVAGSNRTLAINVTNGGHLTTTTGDLTMRVLLLTPGAANSAKLTIDGTGSLVDVAGGLLGPSTANTTTIVTISGGGALRTGGGSTFGAPTGNTATVNKPSTTITGAGSNWTSTGALTMTNAAFTLDQGGTASFANATFGSSTVAGRPAVLTIAGAGSKLSTTVGDLVLGSGATGSGTLTLSDGGAIDVAGSLVLADNASATGILNIGAAGGSPATAVGTFSAPSLLLGSATSQLNFNHTNSDYLFGAAISGAGAINQFAGDTNLTGASTAYTGTTTVSGGTLRVNGTLGDTTSVVNVSGGGRLGGAGTIGGNVNITDGVLAPGNSPGTLTIGGDLSLASNSLLDYEFGRSDVVGGPLNDLTEVGGNLTLDGTINVTVTPGGEFGVGVYRVIAYAGTLTNNGLTLGSVPAGSIAQVQTVIPGQINLVNFAGADVNFWDGNGARGDNVITGGSGTWQAPSGNTNWTLIDGSLNNTYSDSNFAIFMGAAGTVTVDTSLGAVNASGMQFARTGYTIAGGTVGLAAPQSIIRVGDGTAAGAGYTATIGSVLTGSGQLVKTDLGTLILSGANSHTGGTAINGGTLQVTNDGNLGAANGGLSFNNGTLRIVTSTVSNRDVVLNGTGTVLTGTSANWTLNGNISGAGALNLNTSGVITLTGDATHTGVTTVTGTGSLQIGAGGTSGTIAGDIVNNAGQVRFDRSDASTYGGSITGSGSFSKAGAGLLVLTGNSNYSGTTLINNGEVRINAGNTVTTANQANINNGGTLTVSGLGSTFTATTIGSQGGQNAATAINVENGGVLRATTGGMSIRSGPSGPAAANLNITGAGSLADIAGTLTVASNNAVSIANVTIAGGGALRSTGANVVGAAAGNNTAPTVTITDAGSNWTSTGTLAMTNGDFKLLNGGAASFASATFGSAAGMTTNLLLSGPGSVLTTTGNLTVATGTGTGILTLAYSGSIAVGGSFALADNGGATGVLNIGGAEGQAATAAGLFSPATLNLGSTTSRINFNHTDSAYAFSALLSGTGSVNQVAGTTILSGANSYSGATNVIGGTLVINGNQSAATGLTTVGAAARLGGSGVIGGSVDMSAGGTLAPGNSPGTLAINGNLLLGAGTKLAFELGQAGTPGGALNDLVNVGGNLTLDGTIDVTTAAGGSFDLGLYRVFNYGGGLTDNGLTIGATPGGTRLLVQTSVANQVNLINAGTAVLSFWDGAAGPKFNGAIDGGNGIWQAAGTDNWADAAGAVNAAFDNGTFAVFAGAPGTVTVDDGLGAVTASGLQFASNGYVVQGDALMLTGPQATIRVGDGTRRGAGYVATMAAELTGTAQLVKTDAGELALTGTNTYTGGTAINGGTLRIATDANLGTAASGLSFNGGALRTTADLTTGRAVDLAGQGTFRTDAGTTLTLSGAITGTGSLVKADTGTLVLSGSGAYAGGTAVDAGTLLVNGNFAAATGLMTVASGATLGGTGTIGGSVQLNGTLAPGAGSTGTLAIGGNLTIGQGATLAYEFGQAGAAGGALNDLVKVGGNLTLDGTIDVTVPAGGTFDTGIYRVFDYAGTLTNNGLTLGALPAGSQVAVQTSIAGQVNLVNFTGLALNFWDGGTGGKNDGMIAGGNGTWQAGTATDDWTEASGAINAGYSNGGFAVFGGTGGTVTVDNSAGQVSAAGMQFATGGYTIAGGAIALTDPQTTIRVGDGSTAGAGYTATITAPLSGATELVKTDAGTLVLGGANLYTGGTRINGGTLQVAGDANLGAAAGQITLDGGTLATSADMTSARSFVLTGNGTLATANATTLTLTGQLSGSGALTKAGAGTLLLTGDNGGYTGGTTVAAGTLAVTGTLGSAVSVGTGSRLEGTGRVGAVTNSGIVAAGRGGFGTLTLASYAGSGGRLEIETALGGDASPTDLLVVSGATSGTTTIDVVNRGGLGAQTRDGIKIVDVAGASNGTFTLDGDYAFEGQQAVIAGAYGYRLYKNGVSTPSDGDWYLRSTLLDAGAPGTPEVPNIPLYQPGVPVYEAYGQTMLALTELGTMQERIGNRQWGQTSDGRTSGIWGRMEAKRTRPNATQSTSFSDVNVDSWKFELGTDHVLSQRGDGATLVLGVIGSYGEATAEVASLFGNGRIKTKGYGAGATLTWFGPMGFYVDTRAQLTWFDSKLKSAILGTLASGNDGTGQAYSIELGKRASVGGMLSLIPQIQAVYSTVGFDRFTDPNDAVVSSKLGDSFKTRWGLSLDRQDAHSHVYAVANLSYEWLDGTITDVSGTPIARSNHRLWGELGLGGSATLGERVTLYGQATANTALQDFGKSYSLRGTVGLRMAF